MFLQCYEEYTCLEPPGDALATHFGLGIGINLQKFHLMFKICLQMDMKLIRSVYSFYSETFSEFASFIRTKISWELCESHVSPTLERVADVISSLISPCCAEQVIALLLQYSFTGIHAVSLLFISVVSFIHFCSIFAQDASEMPSWKTGG